MGAAAEQILTTGVAENIEPAGSAVAAAGYDTLMMMAAENFRNND